MRKDSRWQQATNPILFPQRSGSCTYVHSAPPLPPSFRLFVQRVYRVPRTGTSDSHGTPYIIVEHIHDTTTSLEFTVYKKNIYTYTLKIKNIFYDYDIYRVYSQIYHKSSKNSSFVFHFHSYKSMQKKTRSRNALSFEILIPTANSFLLPSPFSFPLLLGGRGL